MQYVLLIYERAESFEKRERPADDAAWGPWRAYHQALLQAGVYLGGSPLTDPSTTATTVRIRGGERQVQDGPFADTKEQLGGFIILELPTLDAALEWASRCPAAEYGAVEVRPAADLTQVLGSTCGPKGLPQ